MEKYAVFGYTKASRSGMVEEARLLRENQQPLGSQLTNFLFTQLSAKVRFNLGCKRQCTQSKPAL